MKAYRTLRLQGQALRAARERMGVTQAGLAGVLKLHRVAITEIEAGRRDVSLNEAHSIADYYGIGVDALVSWSSKLVACGTAGLARGKRGGSMRPRRATLRTALSSQTAPKGSAR